MIEHINIIDTLHSQIEALLDLMQCANPDCTDVKSINVAAEMSQTMLDELMTEIKGIENDWRQAKAITEKVKEQMCDHYCRYTCNIDELDIESICSKCPMNKLEG